MILLSEFDVNLEDLSLIMGYLKEFYGTFEDLSMFIIDLEEIFNNIDSNKKAKEEFIKKLIQLLLFYNITILKSRSASAIRHFFPPEISEDILPYNFGQFVKALKKAFKFINIEIELKKTKEEGEDKKSEDLQKKRNTKLYFYLKDYESILRFLLYWDTKWLPFPENKLTKLRTFLSTPNIYLYFDRNFMEQFFGENGLIERNSLTITKFFEDIFDLSSYKRHSIYKWRDENFFPATVLYDINKSKYRDKIDIDYYKYIKHIKIGKAQEINKTLLDQIKDNYENNLDRFIPASDSMLGFILYNPSYLAEEKFNPLQEYNEFLEKIHSKQLAKYSKEIDKIKDILKVPESLITIKSIRLKNFKAYSNVKIDFQKGINIIYGENGSGKTSILDAILFALYLDSWHEVHINDFYNLDLKFLNTQVIRVGEKFCEVELELEKEEEIIRFIRKLWKNGKHEIKINNVDLYDKIKKRVIEKFKKEALEIEESPVFAFYSGKGLTPRRVSIIKFFINNKLNQIFANLLRRKELSFSYKLILGEYEGLQVGIKGIDFDQYFDSTSRYFSAYFEIIDEEIKSEYDKVDCLFSKNDIFSSIFQEYEHIRDLDYSKLQTYILNKFGVKFIEDYLIYKEREQLSINQIGIFDLIKIYSKMLLPKIDSETLLNYHESSDHIDKYITELEPKFRLYRKHNIEETDSKHFLSIYLRNKELKEKINFLEDARDFLFNLFLTKFNENLIKLSKEYFAKERFYCFLDKKGIPKIDFYENDEVLPISNLSGGERSKLLLIIISFLIKISNKNSFFLIDEPNELLDHSNVNNMKTLFLKLFENKQILICTFIDNYKNFKPALIYHVEKDLDNVSRIIQISPIRKSKNVYYLFEEEAREFIKPILKEKGYSDIEFEVKIGGYRIDILAKVLILERWKKSFGEIAFSNRFITKKIENFANWLLSLKGNEYNPDKGDSAFIITQSSVIPRKAMDILKKHNIELIIYTPKQNQMFSIKEEKYSLSVIPGLGPLRIKRLNSVGIYSVRDLLICNSRIIARQIPGIGEATLNKLKQSAKEVLGI